MGFTGLIGNKSSSQSNTTTTAQDYASTFGYDNGSISSEISSNVTTDPVGYDDGWGNIIASSPTPSENSNDYFGGLNPVSYDFGSISSAIAPSSNISTSQTNNSDKKSFFGSIFSGIGNLFTSSDSVSNNSNNSRNSMGVASGVVSSLGAISGSVSDILTSGDKVEIAKYQAQGEVAKAEAIIAAAQAKADAEAQAAKDKASNQKTYIILGVVAFLVLIIALILISSSKKDVPVYQYYVPKPVMPNVQQTQQKQLQPLANRV